MSAAQPERDGYDDDLMAIADAVGVTVPSGPAFTDAQLDAVLSAWSRAAAGIPDLGLTTADLVDLDAIAAQPTGFYLVDHVGCDGPDCDRTICACKTTERCDDLAELACPHLLLLCDECRSECPDCRVDATEGGWRL